MNVLSCGPEASNISGISDAGDLPAPVHIPKNLRRLYARVLYMMAQFVQY